MTKWLGGLAVALTVIAAAGCGGSGRLSKGQFISQADAICTRVHTQAAKISFPSGDPSTASPIQLKQIAAALDQALVLERQQIGDLRKLKPPKDFDSDFKQSMDELTQGLDYAGVAAVAARNGDGAGVTKALDAAQAKTTTANDRAKTYGLQVCGSS